MSLSLERLQALLKQDAERKAIQAEQAKQFQLKHQHRASKIDAAWRSVGVLPPPTTARDDNTPYWERPVIQRSLFKCSLSSPQTTLVPWKSLPAHVQSKLRASEWRANVPKDAAAPVAASDGDAVPQHDASPGIVEVPLAYLNGDDQTAEGGSAPGEDTTKHRPVKGNLSDKLSEYTRGLSGGQRTQLFRPGGLDARDDPATKQHDLYRTEAAIARSQKVLMQGSKASWKDGSLITAPPGVDFKVGLSYKDVYPGSDDEDDDTKEMESGTTKSVGTATDTKTIPAPTQGITQQVSNGDHRATSKSMFTRSYFDDDSLFGSSSSSESEGDDDDDDDANEDDSKCVNESDDGREKSGGNDSVFVGGFDPSQLVADTDDDATSATTGTSEEAADLDQLLTDLTISDEKMFSKKKANGATAGGGDIGANALQLAEKQSQNQTNTTRKSWATTKLLPITDFNALIPNPAMTWSFTLDDFQQQAVARLERSESVFVAAHTSAGKTVVAEYAVALAKQRSTRCIYTSPIKALSNQKFRDFSLKFGAANVGLVTGDLQVNVDDSTCLIMTTEILRSMLYRGADLIRDIEYVVFDEVHYVNDSERGVVWEEVIIMLPTHVNLIFLSATTPNTLEFSDWIGRTKRKVVHVVTTSYRPVPLSHFLWAGTKLNKVLQGNGSFLEKGYSEAANALLPASAKDPKKKGEKQQGRPATGSKQLAWQAQGSKQNWMSLVRFLDRELLTPAVVFSFSKKKCEEIAAQLRSLDLNTSKEAGLVQGFTLQTVARLSKNDSKLPQVLTIVEMVKRGIGVHHGGLLPILKEMVEILFSRNLIKVLFATETFAMGVNMPAKAVIFNSIRKHDGTGFRVLEPGEYTQMAGRAGRRGLDKVGTVILCCFGETPPPQQILKQMLTGRSTSLNSQFRLTYNMILNLLKVEEMSVEAMIKRSFSEFATQRALTANEYPQLLARGIRTLEKLEEQWESDAPNRIGAEDIDSYYSVCNELLEMSTYVLSTIRENDISSFNDVFQPGTIVLVTAARQYGVVRAPAMVLRAPAAPLKSDVPGAGNMSKANTLVCLVLMPTSFLAEESGSKNPGSLGYVGSSQQRHYAIQEFEMNQVLMISGGKRRKIDVKAIHKEQESTKGKLAHDFHRGMGLGQPRGAPDPFAGMQSFGKKDDAPHKKTGDATNDDRVVDQAVGYLIEAERAELHESGLPTLELQNMVKRGNDVVEIRQLCVQVEEVIARMRFFESHRHPNLEKHYCGIERKETLRMKVETLRHLLSNESLQLFPDFLQRKAVLRKLGYVDDNETVCIKGRVACEVNTCEELIATELVFEGILNDLSPEEIVAVLSSLVYQQKSSDDEFDSELPEKLVSCCNKLKKIATNLGQLQKECGLEIDPGEFCDKTLKFGLVHVVYEWALGVPFKEICELTDAQEGSIVRCITRLDELCREIRNCARVVGNPTLYRKLESASTAIKRDIVFASSLYVT